MLKGARALAVPLTVGQSLIVTPNSENILNWQASTPDGLWFDASMSLPELEIISTSDKKLGNRISEILKYAMEQSVVKLEGGFNVLTETGFDPGLGFGTSSTLISNIGVWLNINPYQLLEKTFGGSGFDIACARHNKPILFRRSGDSVMVDEVEFSPKFKNHIYFVYLGKKQVSSQSISDFQKKGKYDENTLSRISNITDEIVAAESISEFEELLFEHEKIMASVLELPTVKEQYFNDVPGIAKSLGAWGGDMVLLTSHESEKDFLGRLSSKGFDKVFRFDDLLK